MANLTFHILAVVLLVNLTMATLDISGGPNCNVTADCPPEHTCQDTYNPFVHVKQKRIFPVGGLCVLRPKKGPASRALDEMMG